MSNYEINTTNFTVTQGANDPYSIGLNYEAPVKGVQYQNLILDDIGIKAPQNIVGKPIFA